VLVVLVALRLVRNLTNRVRRVLVVQQQQEALRVYRAAVRVVTAQALVDLVVALVWQVLLVNPVIRIQLMPPAVLVVQQVSILLEIRTSRGLLTVRDLGRLVKGTNDEHDKSKRCWVRCGIAIYAGVFRIRQNQIAKPGRLPDVRHTGYYMGR
jgi:hypothetical protein